MGDDDEDELVITTAAADPSSTIPLSRSKEDLKQLSAQQLRDLRRQRLTRDNRGESKEEEDLTFDYAYQTVLASYILSIGSEDCYDNNNGGGRSDNSMSSQQQQQEYHHTSMMHNNEESKSSLEDSTKSHYSRLEAAIQSFSTSIMETMFGGWCGEYVDGDGDEDATIIVDDETGPSQLQLQQHHPIATSPTEQTTDPFDIIQDPQVAAILKKNRNRQHYNDANYYAGYSDASSSTYNSTDTHLRALEIVARNKISRNNKPTTTNDNDETAIDRKAALYPYPLYKDQSMTYFRSHQAL
mmetsp:Transcript_29599/g.71238  ORF Transcript_29599/g.71238 Transcript_29599/m.71238 type:complete len:298 (+) Transcript_29599:303-1196(+)